MRFFLAVVAMSVGMAADVGAQPARFGSFTDPTEAPIDPRGAARVAFMGGPSYIGVRWHAGVGVLAEGAIGPFGVSLEGNARIGPGGIRTADFDDAYDVLRLLRYARVEPTVVLPAYVRIGPIRRLTLESGLLVRDFATIAAWDERTIGVEAAVALPELEMGGFTADIRPNNLVGAFAAIRPFGPAERGLRTTSISAVAVHDLGLADEVNTTAVAAEAQVDILRARDIRAGVVAGHARFLNYGHGTLAGAQGALELFDLGLLHTRLGLTVSSDHFIPGYFNAFYPVRNPRARIVSSDAYFHDPDTAVLVGTALDEAPGGTALFWELHAIVYGILELAQYVRRDFGGDTGEYALRIAFTVDRGQTLRFLFDIQRQGLRGLRDIFVDVVDEAILTFRLDYAATPRLHLFIRSRYGYTDVGRLPDGTVRYLVERRFEPMVGLTLWR
jgi:hypothetical protein